MEALRLAPTGAARRDPQVAAAKRELKGFATGLRRVRHSPVSGQASAGAAAEPAGTRRRSRRRAGPRSRASLKACARRLLPRVLLLSLLLRSGRILHVRG